MEHPVYNRLIAQYHLFPTLSRVSLLNVADTSLNHLLQFWMNLTFQVPNLCFHSCFILKNAPNFNFLYDVS
jgi:hypothetical protein